MQESALCFHNLEWPPAGACLAGPVVWLRGWIVGQPGHDFIDVRVRHGGGIHLGVLGLPRVDLAAHFRATRPWLPAEFILGVPVADGPVTLALEAMDAHGAWHELQSLALIIAPDGAPAPRVEGRLESSPDGSWTVRDAHHPLHGHLDDPGPAPRLRHGRAPVFGWLLDETRPLAAVLATTDTLVFNHLEHSLTDDALAAKVSHPGARRARLRGEVDFPVTIFPPACLRVYAVSSDGSACLCFAQRITPAEAPVTAEHSQAASYPPVTPRSLPPLPSGRPRRLLLVTRSLWPNDATLRALDLARHLTAGHQWACRLVSTEDGPLRHDFERANIGSLVVDPEPLFSACDETAMQHALGRLQRQIWWGALDAVAVFDPVCGWAITLARRQNIPVLFDCLADEPMEPDPTALPAVQTLLRDGWRSATALCFGSAAAARAQHSQFGDRPAEIIAQWHSPNLPPRAAADGRRVALAPLRTVDWLVRQYPAVAAHWSFRQGPAGLNSAERLVRQDDPFNAPALQHGADWSIGGIALCLGPLFGRGPLRPVLDAAAAGVPLAAPRTPTTEEWFAETRLPLSAEDNPLALAHALLACDTQPELDQRESTAAAARIQARHSPGELLSRWAGLLATVAATRG
ncbi:MAG: hypothetical protein HYV95_12565 [Opitutae bacterium]|nr:hypothetical protein [Opitutae bacterium]